MAKHQLKVEGRHTTEQGRAYVTLFCVKCYRYIDIEPWLIYKLLVEQGQQLMKNPEAWKRWSQCH